MSSQEVFCAKDLKKGEVATRVGKLQRALSEQGTCVLSDVVELPGGRRATMRQEWVFPAQAGVELQEIGDEVAGLGGPRRVRLAAPYNAGEVEGIVRVEAAEAGEHPFVRLAPSHILGKDGHPVVTSYPETVAATAKDLIVGNVAVTGAAA
jgi:hypothetical protein